MGVFAKLDGLKRPPVANDFSFNYEEIKVTYMDPRAQGALQMAGLSKVGIDELKNAKALSNPSDRKVVSAIVAAALG